MPTIRKDDKSTFIFVDGFKFRPVVDKQHEHMLTYTLDRLTERGGGIWCVRPEWSTALPGEKGVHATRLKRTTLARVRLQNPKHIEIWFMDESYKKKPPG